MTNTLRDFVSAAADAYAATGHASAVAAAEMLRDVAARENAAVDPGPGSAPDLGAAVAAMDPGPLRRWLERDAANLPWSGGAFEKPASVAGRYVFVEIAGPGGMLVAPALRFGLYLQAPETFYPAHWHAAEELYYVLSGKAGWQKGDGPFVPRPPGSLIDHASLQRHAMQTDRDPLLALWLWTGDLDPSSYRIDGA